MAENFSRDDTSMAPEVTVVQAEDEVALMDDRSENDTDAFIKYSSQPTRRYAAASNRRRDDKCGNVLAVLKDEFLCKNFGFNFPSEEVFYSCQWPWPRIVFVTYRLVLATYSTVILVYSIIGFDHNKWHKPWPVWLTNWSYCLLTAHLVCAATIAVIHSRRRRWFERDRLHHDTGPSLMVNASAADDIMLTGFPTVRWYLQLDWLLFATSTCAALIVTAVYFGGLFPAKHERYLSADDANLHMMNSVMVLLEFCVCAMPVRLLHFVYVLIYSLAYVIFSVVYWSFDHKNVLYPGVLDWNHPETTIPVIVILAVAGIPFIVTILFLAYRLRVCIHRKLYMSNI